MKISRRRLADYVKTLHQKACRTCNTIIFLHSTNQIIDLWRCRWRCRRQILSSLIDHRWRQNVVRTKKWHTRRSRVCHWCSYHILTSSVIYYARQHGIYLFYIIKKLRYRKKCPFISNFATLTDTKIALTWSYVYIKWSELIGCYA